MVMDTLTIIRMALDSKSPATSMTSNGRPREFVRQSLSDDHAPMELSPAGRTRRFEVGGIHWCPSFLFQFFFLPFGPLWASLSAFSVLVIHTPLCTPLCSSESSSSSVFGSRRCCIFTPAISSDAFSIPPARHGRSMHGIAPVSLCVSSCLHVRRFPLA